jgi:small subunit ribosomal protein S6
MLKQYETIIINSPLITESQLKDSIKKYKDFLVKNGAEIVHEEDWGMRKFAYPIKKKTSGFYHLFEYKVETSVIAKLETEFNRDEKILRYLTVFMDKYGVEYNEKRRQSGKKQVEFAEEHKDLLND